MFDLLTMTNWENTRKTVFTLLQATDQVLPKTKKSARKPGLRHDIVVSLYRGELFGSGSDRFFGPNVTDAPRPRSVRMTRVRWDRMTRLRNPVKTICGTTEVKGFSFSGQTRFKIVDWTPRMVDLL